MSALFKSGVCTHSREEAFNRYIIFCVGNNIAKEAAFKAWAAEHSVPYKSMYGAYKSVVERCFMVNQRLTGDVYQWFKHEETILLLHPLWDIYKRRMLGARPAELVYVRDIFRRNKELGFFVQQPKEYALTQESYTFDPATNTYWVAE